MKKAVRRLLLSTLLVVMGLMLVSCKKEYISIGDYVSIDASGYDGFAIGKVIVDNDRLKKDLISKKILKSDEAQLFVDELSATIDDKHISKKTHVTIKIGSKYEDNKYIDCSDRDILVKGLDEVKLVDAFANVSVKLEGISPKIRVVVLNESDDEYVHNISLKYENKLYKVGDELKVLLEIDKDKAGRDGYTFKEFEKTYVLGNVSYYPEDEKALDNETLHTLYDLCAKTVSMEAIDNTKHIMWRLSGDNSYLLLASVDTKSSVSLEKILYLKEKVPKEDREENFLYVICKGVLANKDVEITGYFAFEFKDVYIDKEGKCVISTNSIEKRYISSTNYESLYNDLITTKSEEYKTFEVDYTP